MITKSISGHENFIKLDLEKREAFVEDFVQKAEGVFIWVKLILKDVVEELDYD